MVIVNVRPMLPTPNPIINTLEEYHFNGETVFTFHGRCFVDLILVIGLFFFMGRILLAIVTGGLIAAVIAVKDREVELYQHIFGGGSSGGLPQNNGGVQYSVGDNTMGGYQSVDT